MTRILSSDSEVESRTQPSRPRTLKNPRPRTDLSRTRPRIKAQMFSKKKGLPKFSARLLPISKVKWQEGHGHGPFLTKQKSAVLEPRTGRFRALVSFEAKDLTFLAKDFKMCPRG